jgi:PAS domain S-box-containing protein
MFGYNAAEMIGKPIAALFPPNRHIEEAGILDRTRRAERCDHYEAIADYKDGTSIDASVIVLPAKDETGTVVGGSKIVRDITERKEAQARHDILTCEIKHAPKNLLEVGQAVVSGARREENRRPGGVRRPEPARFLGSEHLLLMISSGKGSSWPIL